MEKKKPILQSFLQIFATRGNIKAFGLGCGLLFFQQFSGINAVLFYAQVRLFQVICLCFPTSLVLTWVPSEAIFINKIYFSQDIFQKTGSSLPPEICTIIIGIVQIVASAGTLLLTSRFSMKVLLIFSGFGMALAHVSMSSCASVKSWLGAN